MPVVRAWEVVVKPAAVCEEAVSDGWVDNGKDWDGMETYLLWPRLLRQGVVR